MATSLIAAMSASEKEHEETLTGTLLGSLLASNSLLALFTAHLGLPPTQCWWGSYSKYRSSDQDKTEAGSGADFALLTLPETGGARLAIFQAKRGEMKEKKWIFDANRVPQPPRTEGAKDRDAQMVVLAETAKRLESIADPGSTRINKLPPVAAKPPITKAAIIQAGLGTFDWIHYLAYTSDGVRCIALRHLTHAYLKELSRVRTKTEVELDTNSTLFLDVVTRGAGPDASHWLEFEDAKSAIDSLPNLLPLVPVVVVDGADSHGPALAKHEGMSQLKLDLSVGPIAELVEKAFEDAPDGAHFSNTRRPS